MKMNCLCPLKVAVGERVLRCATCGLEFAPSVYERPSSELRMTFEEENAFILANRGKVPAAFNPKCVDCMRLTETHGYAAACLECYAPKHPCADEQVTSAKACIMEALAVVWPQQQCVRGLASCAGAS